MMKKKKFMFMFMLVLVLVLVLLCCVECVGGGGGEMISLSTKQQQQQQGKRNRHRKVVVLSIFFGSISGVIFALVSACVLRFILRFIKKPTPILKGPVVFSPLISPKSLQSAIQQQLQLISRTYYTTTLLDNSFPIALKKIHYSSNIQRQLQILASLRHTHLMTLRAYYHSSNQDLYLVYDYIPTGTLEDVIQLHLHIAWDARLRIAVGIIKALHYLHSNSILHYNLKPSNVLLDAHFQPTLTDSALPTPPQYFSLYTEKSDIFSFGLILGTLLTGRDPSDPFFVEVTSMGMWFRHLVEAGDAREALDKTLLQVGQETEEDEMLMAVRIAAVCLSDLPPERPSAHELVPMLTQLHSF